MTREKLKELNILAGRIERLKSYYEDLSYIKEQDNIEIRVKDGRKLGEHWVEVPVPRSLRIMICNELQYKIGAMFVEAEKEFAEG